MRPITLARPRHVFVATAFGGLVITRWRCRNCGLKVGSRRAADQLHGQPCR